MGGGGGKGEGKSFLWKLYARNNLYIKMYESKY